MEIWTDICLQRLMGPGLGWGWARRSSQCGSGAPAPTQRAASIPSGLGQQQWTNLKDLEKVQCLC